ncbi:MAG: secretin and TonB N-terminal domain-containing protein [Sphingobium sp.]
MLLGNIRAARLLCGSSLMIVALSATTAMAQVLRSYDIPAQTIGSALETFGRQSGKAILFDPQQLGNVRSGAVHGKLEANAALRQILAPTGARLEKANDDTFVVRPAQVTLRPVALQVADTGSASAVAAPPPQENVTNEEIIVTGSRIVRDGYSAPTPVTVLPVEQLAQAAPSNIPDALNKMPQFFNSRGAASSITNANAPFAGNYLNLRGIGAVRSCPASAPMAQI